MIKTLTTVITASCLSASFGETLLLENFEGNDFAGYTITGSTGSVLSSFQSANSGTDFIVRTNSASASGSFGDPTTGFSGNFIALEDIASLSAFPTPEGFLTLEPITGAFTGFQLGISIAAPDETPTRYEVDDLIELQYSVDGGAWVTAPGTTFRGNGTDRGLFNGATNVTTNATQVTASLPGVESTSQFQARVRFISGIQEEMAFDDFFVNGEAAIPEPTSSLLLGITGIAFTFRRSRRQS